MLDSIIGDGIPPVSSETTKVKHLILPDKQSPPCDAFKRLGNPGIFSQRVDRLKLQQSGFL